MSGLFSELMLPEQDRDAILRMRRQSRADNNQERTQQGMEAFSPAMRSAFMGGSMLGQGISNKLNPTQIDAGTENDLQVKEATQAAMRAVSETEEYRNAPAGIRSEMSLEAAQEALVSVGDVERATKVQQQLAEKRRLRLIQEKQIESTAGGAVSDIQKINDAFEAADRAREQGDTRGATAFEALAAKIAGIKEPDADKPSVLDEARDLAAGLGYEPGSAEFRNIERAAVNNAVGMSERNQRIDDHINLYGISREKATALEDGIARIVTDPASGNAFLVNELGDRIENLGTVDSLPIGEAGEQVTLSTTEPGVVPPGRSLPVRPAAAPGKTIFELLDLATGVENRFKYGLETIMPMVGVDTETLRTEATQTISTEANLLAKTLQQSPRYAEGERAQILRDIVDGLKPGLLFREPETQQARLQAIWGTLWGLGAEELALVNAEGVPREERNQARTRARTIGSFMQIIAPMDMQQEWAEAMMGPPAGGDIADETTEQMLDRMEKRRNAGS